MSVRDNYFERAPLKPPVFCLQNAKIALNGAQSPRGLRKNRGFAAQNPGFCHGGCANSSLFFLSRLRAKINSFSWRCATPQKTSKFPLCLSRRGGTLMVMVNCTTKTRQRRAFGKRPPGRGGTLHRAPVGQEPSGPDWLTTALWFGSGRALAAGKAWAGRVPV